MNLFNIFILSFGALQSVLLIILLLRKKACRTAYFFLLLYLLALLLQTVLKIASKIWLMQNIPVVYGLSYHLPFLYGPLLYFFVRNMALPPTSTNVFQKPEIQAVLRVSAWHFLPFLYFASVSHLARTYQNDLTLKLFYFFADKIFYCQVLSLLAYHMYSYMWLRRQNEAGNMAQKGKWGWLRRHTLVSCLVTGSITVGMYLIHLYHPRYEETRFLFAAVTIYIYWLSYEAMRRPERFYLTSAGTSVSDRGEGATAGPQKYGNSTLTMTETEAILATLQRVMLHQRPYLKPDLNIDALASLVGTNRHHLSQVINGRLQKNFYEYLNEHRVKAAAQQLSDPAVGHLKIAAIAYDVGFNSLSTFNEVFKKMTGHTPSEFRKKGNFRAFVLPSISDW